MDITCDNPLSTDSVYTAMSSICDSFYRIKI